MSYDATFTTRTVDNDVVPLMATALLKILLCALSLIPVCISGFFVSWIFCAITGRRTKKYRLPAGEGLVTWSIVLALGHFFTTGIACIVEDELKGSTPLILIFVYSLVCTATFMAVIALLIAAIYRAYKVFTAHVDAVMQFEDEGLPLNNMSFSKD